MKKFVLQILLFIAILITVLLGICPYGRIDDNSVSASIVDKNRRLREASEKPRLVFLGGSSVAMGTNSKRIAKEACDGEYKPVNMGLCAGLGLDFILNGALPNIREDDLVVLSIEYQLFTDEARDGRYDMIHNIRLYDTASLPEMTTTQTKVFFDKSLYRYMRRFQRKIKDYKKARKINIADIAAANRWEQFCEIRSAKLNNPKPPFTREGINEAGDMISHLDLTRTIDDNVIVFEGPIDKQQWQTSIDMINEFTEECNDKGADVVFFMTMISEYNYETDPELFDTFADYFDEKASPELLNQPEESLVEDNCFFNTGYHLNREGRKIRCDLMIEKLKEFIEDEEDENS